MYKHGLIIGKFMPFHLGHKALIDFGALQCDKLSIAVCTQSREPIDGDIRYKWVKAQYSNDPCIYTDHITEELPYSQESSRTVSQVRGKFLKERYPDVDVIITSEPYGDFVAEYMNIAHISFNPERNIVPVSGTEIRDNPFTYWEYLPDHVKPYFVKKIILVGTESTGKSILTRHLAHHFHTNYVAEMARGIIETTEEVQFEHLTKIAEAHATQIRQQVIGANKLLFCDTDILVTKSYSNFLFGKELEVDEWVEKVNKGDLYLFLEPDCPYVQDGTRLNDEERQKLSDVHKGTLLRHQVAAISINGKTREERLQKAISTIDGYFFAT